MRACDSCGQALGRLECYRCPDCGADLTGDEKATSGRDKR